MQSTPITVSADDLEDKSSKPLTVSADDLEAGPQTFDQPKPGQIDLSNSRQTIPAPDISPDKVLPDWQRQGMAQSPIDLKEMVNNPDVVDISPKRGPYPYLSDVLPTIPQSPKYLGGKGKLKLDENGEIADDQPDFLPKPVPQPDIIPSEQFAQEHPIEAALADTGLDILAHVAKGVTLGTVDIPGGKAGVPFGHKESYTGPIENTTPDINIPTGHTADAGRVNAYLDAKEKQQGLEVGSLGRYSQQQIDFLTAGASSGEPEALPSPELEEAIASSLAPTSVGMRAAGESGAVMLGSALPYSRIAKLVDAALLKVPGMAPAVPALSGAAGEAAAPAAGAIVPYSKEALDAVNLMQQSQAIRRIAGQAITGGIFNAIEPREPGETIPGRLAEGAVAGAGFGVANEALGVAARALQDRQFGKALEKLHKELSDELLARQEIELPNGQKVKVNSREAADKIAQDFLNKNLRPDIQTKDLNKAAEQIRDQRAGRVQKTERAAGVQPKSNPNGNRTTPPEEPPTVNAKTKPKGSPPGPPEGTAGLLEQEKVTRGDTVLVPDAEGKAIEAKVDFAAPADKGNWVRVVMPDGSKARFDRTQIGKVPETVHADDLAAQGEGSAEGVQEPAENIPKNIPQTIHADELQTEPAKQEPLATKESTVELSDKFKQGDTVKVGEETGKVIAATKNNVRVKIGAQERMVTPGEIEKVEPEKQEFKYGSTQINIAPESELGKAHAEAVNKIPEEHLGAHGRETTPHVTLRYGLEDTSPETVSKIREAAAQIEPFEVPVGKTRTFPVSEHSEGTNPVVAHLEKTPELMKLRDAGEKAGNFKPDNFKEYKPHVTLAYVKPEHAHKYEGRGQLEGRKVPVKEIAVSKQDGSQEIIPLGGSHAVPESGSEKVLQRQPGENGESGSGRGRVEPVQQGDEVAPARPPQEETAAQPHEPGGGQGNAEQPVSSAKSIDNISENSKPAKGDHVTASTPEGKVEGKVVDVHGNQHGRGMDVLTQEGEIKKVKAEEVQAHPSDELPTGWSAIQSSGGDWQVRDGSGNTIVRGAQSREGVVSEAQRRAYDINTPATEKWTSQRDAAIKRERVKKLAPESGQEHTKSEHIEHTGEPEGAPRVQSEGRRQVPHPEGQDRPPLGGTPPQVLPEPQEKRNTGRSSKRSSSGDHPATPRPATEGPEPGASQGTGLPELADAGERKPQRSVNPKNQDWFTHPEKFDVSGTPGERLKRNLQALRVVAEVQKTGRGISDEERNALASYTGWGAIPQVFDTSKANYSEESQWKRAQAELKKLLTPQEYDRARNSTQNAHYTSPGIVRFMWQVATRMGFKGGTVLEPSMGTGNFFGMMPRGIRGKVNAIGNEMDPSTFYISKMLYPGATIYNQNYVDLILPDNSIDLAIGNVPFGEKVYDPKYPKLNARIHDYFLVKTIDKVRPGGLMMFITSDGTLDKQNTSIRDILADKADLVYAVRFPSSAFEENAGTEVVTDLVVLRKRAPEQVAKSESFTHTVPVAENVSGMMGRPEAKGLKINEYFVQHPKNILGSLDIRRGRYGAEPELTVKGDGPIENRLKNALEDVPRGVMEKANASPIAPGEIILAPETAQEGSLLVHEGKVMQRLNGALSPASSVTGKDGKPSPQLVDRAHKLVDLRDSTQELINLMRTLPEGQPVIAQRQKALARKYDEYVHKHGLLNERRTKDVFADDPQYPLLLSLEDYDRDTKKGEKADIFTKRTIHPPAKLVTVSGDPAEALFQVLSERGFPDVEFMGQLSGKPVEQIAKALESKNLIFKDPLTGQYETSDKYLSGYVREKLVDAQAAVAQGNKEYERNVEALTKVIPEDIPIKVIDVRLGGTYIPIPAIKEFSQSILNAGRAAKISNTAGTWKVGDFYRSPEVTSEYAGGGVHAGTLLENALNLRQTLVYDIFEQDGKEVRQVNQQKSVAAQAAQAKITKKFATFVREHSQWGPQIERLYNDKYNGIVTPTYDGSHLAFPGMSTLGLRDGKLMPHQVNAIRRVIEEGRGLLAHAVGAGKTFEGIVSAMELKRLGRIRKPMFVVPNHKVGDWAEDYQKRYPGARVLVPTKKDFEATNRNKVMARIATGDWDGIIIAHSQFDLMDISPERQRITMEREMDELEATIAAVTEANGKRDRSVKQLEKSKDRLKAKLDALKDLKSDKAILFDQLGVDHLVIDEIQRYKNLTFYTKMSRVAGLSQGNSKRALRLKMKTDYLLEKYNNRGVVGLTGTPVSNTMAEQRHMTVFIAPDVLHKAGINYFDDWAANFGEIITAMELSADGRSFKPRSKFAKFVNVPEMQLMFRSFSDVKTQEDLNLPVPKLEGGKPIVVSVPSTELTEPYIQSIIRRAKAIRGEQVEVMGEDGKPLMTEKKDDKGNIVMRGGKPVMVPQMVSLKRPDPSEDNMLKVTSDGRKIATDARLIDPDLPDHPESKINAVVKSVYEEWKQGQKEKLTQLVFLDMYRFTRMEGGTYDEDTGKREGGRPVEVLNLYHDMRQKWMDKGVPKEEIAIIHDYKSDEQKQKLFDAVNNGRVRILLGSTQKMGEGMNVQKRLKALHHVDAPWKPGELEQRNGRIIRQGNMNDSVRIYNYVTKGSFDAYMLQTLQTKAEFIHQVMSGKFQGRTMVDAASDMVLSLEEMKAIASGNPDVKRKMELEAEIARYEALEREFEASIERNRTRAGMRRQDAAKEHAVIAAMDKVLKDWEKATEGDKFHLKILGKEFNEFEDASKWLKDQDIPVVPFHFEINSVPIRAEYFNLERRASTGIHGGLGIYLPWESQPRSAETMMGMLRSLNLILQPKAMRERIDAAHKRAAEEEQQADKLLELAQTGAFPEAKDLEKARKELKQVSVRLGIDDEEAAMEQQVAADVDNASEEEPQPEDGDAAFDIPAGWSYIEADAKGEVAAHYEPPDGLFPPMITLSKAAKELIAKAVPGLHPSFRGANISGQTAGRVSVGLQSFAMEADGVERTRIEALVRAFDHAGREADAGGLVMVEDTAPLSTLHEELFHAAQRKLGGGVIQQHLSVDAVGRLLEHPTGKKISDFLKRNHYDVFDNPALVSEIAAKIATINPDLFFGKVVTPQEAADWMVEYLNELAEQHPEESVKMLGRHLSGKALEFYDAAQRRATERRIERAAAGKPGEGQEGTGEDGGGLRENPQGIAQASPGRAHQDGDGEEEAVADIGRPVVPTFFSKAEKVADEKLPKISSAQSVIPTLKNAGVKDEEIKWSGLDDFLKDKKLVRKEDLLNFIRENNVQVQEVTKGIGKRPLDERGRPIPDGAGGVVEARDATKFSHYQLTGGDNYRELLLTLPEKPSKRVADIDAQMDALHEKGDITADPKLRAEYDRLLKLRNSKDDFLPPPQFKSSHFEEPNILAHVRFNDRVDADGKKVLFLEEVQSDWHQKGRREGYFTPQESADVQARNRELAARNEVTVTRGSVPDAPFKTSWHELALKRVLRYAAENGYDRIAWTTGEQQAGRYDLSKQISHVTWNANTNEFKAWDIKGDRVVKENVPRQKLGDYIGKDKAEELLRSRRPPQEDVHGDVYELSGQDLKVGGKGMSDFYDQIIPNYLSKYGKKWGAEVGETGIPVRYPGKEDFQTEDLADIDSAAQDRLFADYELRGRYYNDGGGYSPSRTENTKADYLYDAKVLGIENPRRFIDEDGDPWELGSEIANKLDSIFEKYRDEEEDKFRNQNPVTETVHSLDITPAMRYSVMHEGQPLYSLPPSGGGSAPKPAKFEFPDKDVQEEFDAARGIEKPGTIAAFKEGLTRFSHMATRTYEHLPRGERYEQLRFELKKLEKAQSMARDRAAQGLRNILEGLTPEQYYNFSVKVILDDLLETAKDGLEVPFFESKAQLERNHQAISEHVKDDPQVQKALEQRGQLWEKLKDDYTSAMDSIGFKLGNRLSRENYYRHQVLQYANLKGSGQTGKKLRTPTGRGHLKTREGSDLPINTDYLQVEHEVMMHFLVDTESAKVIKFVQQSEDVVNQLKRAAMAQNIEGIMDVFRQLEEMEPDGPSAKQMYKKLNVKQAIAIHRMGELAAFDDLPNGTGKNDFSDLFAELASAYNARKAGLDDAKLSDQAAGQLIRYASWVIRKEPSAAKSAAALLFKGVAEKRAFIKENLGENFQTWRNLVPEGYTIWQPREGHTLYFTQTVPEHLVQGLSEEAGKQLGLTADDLRTVLARGSRFREYVIPTEVAETLDNLRPDIKKTLLTQVAAPLTKAWKIWELSSPRRFLRFRQKHISGQAEAMFVGNPAAFKEIPAAASEIWDYYKNGTVSPMLQGWLDRGGSGSSLLSQEVGEINKLELFRRLYEAQQSNKIKAYSEHIWQAYWKTARLSIDVAESVLRYAAYRRYLSEMRANGGMPKDWGASRPDEVQALKSPQDRAWKMANDLLGAYDDISALGQELRKYAFPFWSFQEINLKRALRFILNAGYESPRGSEERGASGVSAGGAGGQEPPRSNPSGSSGYSDEGRDGFNAYRFGRTVAARAARKSPFLTYRLGKLLLKMSALWAAVTAYNMLFHRKEWEELSEEDRAKPVLIIGRDKDGHIIKTPRLGAMAEILGWFGLDAPQHEIRAWLNGQKNLREVMEDMAKAPMNKLAGQLNNFLKLPPELATKKSLFPDVFHPQTIHDRGDYLAKELGIEEEVKRAKGEPTPGYGHSWLAAIFDKVDEGQNAYYAIEQAKREYLEKQGKFMDDASLTPKGEALRNMKLAAHYGDEKAYEKFLIEYIEAGGTLKQMRQSLKGMDPLGGMSKADKIQFLASLSDEQQNQLTKAIEYYLTYLYPGEHTDDHGEADEQNGESDQVPRTEQ